MARKTKENSAPDPRPALEIIRSGEKTERLERIRVSSIQSEHALVDTQHAKELGFSMTQDRGQLTPILVRAREEDGKVVHDVMDGFHRAEGKRQNGEDYINATVVYGCSNEEMYDLRILAASSVQSVQFPRIAEWITRSFAETEWAQKGFTARQVFGMVASKRKAVPINLSLEEFRDMKKWAATKTEQWGRSPNAIAGILRTVEEADPGLIKMVRSGSGGHDSALLITPNRLRTVVEEFPDKGNFHIQRALLKYALDHQLSHKQLIALTLGIKSSISPDMTEDNVYNLAATIPLPLRKIETYDEEFDDSQINESGSGKSTRRKISHGFASSKIPQGENDVSQNPTTLLQRIAELEEALSTKQIDRWWMVVPTLSVQERIILQKAFEENLLLGTIAGDMHLGLQQVIVLIQSAFAKRSLFYSKKS